MSSPEPSAIPDAAPDGRKKAPRVLFVSTQMEAGGLQVLAMQKMARLRAEGWAVELIFLYRKRPVFVGAPGVSELLDRPPKGLVDLIGIVIGLVSRVRRARPDAVLGFGHYSSPLAAIAGWIGGARRRVATQAAWLRAGRPFSLGGMLDYVCGVTGLYTANVCASRAIERRFARFPLAYRAALTTIQNGVVWTPSRLDRSEARARFGLPPEAFILIASGRLSRQKNHLFLLEVLTRLPGVHLAILGEGEERPALERAIVAEGLAGRVHLLGETGPETVTDFLAAGDVFVFPSAWEGFGLAAAEAMQAGLPTLVADHPALVEVVGRGADAGGMVLPLDPDMWSAEIGRLQADPQSRAAWRDRGRRRGAHFTFDRMLDGYRWLLS